MNFPSLIWSMVRLSTFTASTCVYTGDCAVATSATIVQKHRSCPPKVHGRLAASRGDLAETSECCRSEQAPEPLSLFPLGGTPSARRSYTAVLAVHGLG